MKQFKINNFIQQLTLFRGIYLFVCVHHMGSQITQKLVQTEQLSRPAQHRLNTCTTHWIVWCEPLKSTARTKWCVTHWTARHAWVLTALRRSFWPPSMSHHTCATHWSAQRKFSWIYSSYNTQWHTIFWIFETILIVLKFLTELAKPLKEIDIIIIIKIIDTAENDLWA